MKPPPEGFTPGPQLDSSQVICPHCGHAYHPEAEDYSDQQRVEECDNCQLPFTVWQEFDVTHYTTP